MMKEENIVNEIISDALLDAVKQTNGEDLHYYDILTTARTIQTILFIGCPLWEVSKFVWKTRHPETVKSIVKIAKDNGICFTEAAVNLMLKNIFKKFGKDFPPYII